MAAELADRVYKEIKSAILSGQLRQRQRLDIVTLAHSLRASATPVRQALAILATERLVSIEAARGYYVSFWSERELRDLYLWRALLARWAAEVYQPAPPPPLMRHAQSDYAALLLRHLEVGGNSELARAAEAADERLANARAVEADILGDVDGELAHLAAALSEGGPALRTRLRNYFRRRVTQVAQIRARAGVIALPRNGD